ncbi:hypothetical protein B0J11DRAFT_248692 [Dendryphion nanum]|uniref:Uncharacterized protein n=1 Tax=Dendryphion nanum TaxID=256645 RepID=A0A9P9E2M7_9PLEO|nr:hypothetical protein B0J11DRAFT_248692 [Dendryphion nanum]
MPYCISCGDAFTGPGSLCVFHNPTAFSKTQMDTYNKYDNNNLPLIKYRTSGQGSRHKPHKHREYENFNYYDQSIEQTFDQFHDTNDLSLAPYYHNHTNDHQHSPSHLNHAAQTFTRLTSQHAINSLTLTSTPAGLKTISVIPNKDREQCPVCRKWFPDAERLRMHRWEYSSGCEVHGICFGREEEAFHASKCRHDRCFVKGCPSLYRKEGGWKGSVVEGHVKEWHQ